MENFSPEQILLWARRTVLYLDTEHFEAELKALERMKEEKDENFGEEQEKRIGQLKEIIPAAEEEKKVVIEKHAEIEEELKTKNEWADEMKQRQIGKKAEKKEEQTEQHSDEL